MRAITMALLVGLVSTIAAGQTSPPGEPVGTPILNADAFWKVRTIRQTEQLKLPDGSVKHARIEGNVGAFFQKNAKEIEAPDSVYKIVDRPMVRLPDDTPADWMAEDFDDSGWVRQRGPVLDGTFDAEWKLIMLRGRFDVPEAASTGDLTLSLAYRGGAVVYVNGKEVGRANMPAGNLDVHADADVYPLDAYFCKEGYVMFRRPREEEQQAQVATRIRRITNLKIPASALKQGVNVLAIAIHRSPTMHNYYLRRNKGSYARHDDTRWARVGLLDVSLVAPPGSSVIPNTGLIKGRGFKVWNQSIIQTIFLPDYPDPFVPLKPVKLTGVRNGTFAGQVVVGHDEEITGLKVAVTELKGPGVIPASAITVRYAVPDAGGAGRQPRFFDSLEDAPPDEVPIYKEHGGAIQPIWITVSVPADAKPGDYTAGMTVTAEGMKPTVVPINLRVIDWTLPPVADYVSRLDIVQSPESLALAYDVDMWSDKHIKLLDRTFSLISQIGGKTLYITCVRRTHFGNEHALVRWVRSEDGELTPDLSVVEKYLDVATRHMGKIPGVILYAWEPPESMGHAGGAGSAARTHDRAVLLTVVDPETGRLSARQGPAWGTPESKVFWKKLTDAMGAMLEKRGLKDSMMFGLVGDHRPTKQAMDDITNGLSDPKWAVHSHFYVETWQGYNMGLINALWGIGCSPRDPSNGYSFGWSNPLWLSYYPREMSLHSTLVEHRTKLENWMGALRGYAPPIDKGRGPRGLGRLGADFWQVLRDDRGRVRGSLAGRYPESAWGQLNLNYCVPFMLGKGKDGAVPTVRSEAFRESLKEVEARIFIEKCLLDDEAPTLLGEKLIADARAMLDERIRMCLHSAGDGQPWYVSSGWDVRAEKLFATAGLFARKMGREPNPNLTVEPKKR